jgi:hypothetical protein
MQGYQQQQFEPRSGRVSAQLQPGVQKFMIGVYGWMSVGIGVTAAVAWMISQSATALATVFQYGWLIGIAMVITAIALQVKVPKMSRTAAAGWFVAFSSLVGATLAWVPWLAAHDDVAGLEGITTVIATALLTTIGMFAATALYGYVTKKDLSGMGQFLIMALWGAIIASVVNIFVGSASMSFWISGLVVLVSAGLTAYETQAIKQMYLMRGGAGNLAIFGALLLYINFINMFRSLLYLFLGSRD